jgi:L-iditol 2-dehydrogenase
MQAIVIHKIGAFEIEDLPLPIPAQHDVRVHVAVTGLCRTDLKIIEHGHRDLILPRIPGEEVVGMVDAVGPQTDVSWLGARVYVYPGTACGTCPQCLAGADNLCRDMQIMGFHRDGGFASHVVAPAKSVLRIPDGLSFENAVFAEPLSCCLNALERVELKAGERIAIWGAGPAGTLLARAAQQRGAKVVHIEPDSVRRARTGAVSALLAHERFDVCIPAVGSLEAYNQAIAALAPRGRLVAFSGLLPGSEPSRLSMNSIHYLEQRVVGAYGCAFRHGEEAIQLIASGAIKVADLISHRLPLTALTEALDLVRYRTGMKVLLYP